MAIPKNIQRISPNRGTALGFVLFVARAFCFSDFFLDPFCLICSVFVANKLPNLSLNRVNMKSKCVFKSLKAIDGDKLAPIGKGGFWKVGAPGAEQFSEKGDPGQRKEGDPLCP